MKALEKKPTKYAGIEVTDFVESRAYGYEFGTECVCNCVIASCYCDRFEATETHDFELWLDGMYELDSVNG